MSKYLPCSCIVLLMHHLVSALGNVRISKIEDRVTDVYVYFRIYRDGSLHCKNILVGPQESSGSSDGASY